MVCAGTFFGRAGTFSVPPFAPGRHVKRRSNDGPRGHCHWISTFLPIYGVPTTRRTVQSSDLSWMHPLMLDTWSAARYLANPYSYYAWLRAIDPMHWNSALQLWTLTRHVGVVTTLTNPALSSRHAQPKLDDPAVCARSTTASPPGFFAPTRPSTPACTRR